MTTIRTTTAAAVLVGAITASLLTGCASKASTSATPGRSGAQEPASGIVAPNPTAPADAAAKAVQQLNDQTQQTQQGVQDADPNAPAVKP
jgi:hypothetical protein